MKNVNNFKLTSKITVGDLTKWINEKDKNSKYRIIDFIDFRFRDRYLNHIENIKSGFLKMAISCLMIETLESFKQGQKSTKIKGEKYLEIFSIVKEIISQASMKFMEIFTQIFVVVFFIKQKQKRDGELI